MEGICGQPKERREEEKQEQDPRHPPKSVHTSVPQGLCIPTPFRCQADAWRWSLACLAANRLG